MACGGCRKNNPGGQPSTSRGTAPVNDLSKFAYLTPRQLRLIEQQKKDSGENK